MIFRLGSVLVWIAMAAQAEVTIPGSDFSSGTSADASALSQEAQLEDEWYKDENGIAGTALIDNGSLAAGSGSDWDAVAAIGTLTNAPAVYTTNGASTTIGVGTIQSIMYESVVYTGKTTRVWAYVGLPAGASAANPVPAVVCVHGGGGTAFRDWVQKWNDRGYAAISMDTEGRWVDPATGNKVAQPWGGPKRVGVYGDMANPIGDHFMYHATSAAVLANSLMRSLPEVDADRVGITGISWGGVITSTAIGLDDRFAFAIPIYGIGHMYDALNYWGDTLKNNETYKTVWDPILRLENATMPVLWFSWPGDTFFPMDNQAYCYHGAPGEHMVSLVPGMNHGHGAGWNRPESYDYANDILNNGTGWCVQQSISRTGSDVEVVFATSKPLKSASLIYTTETGMTGNLSWPSTAVTSMVENPAGIWTITGQLPPGTTAWFINTKAGSSLGSSDIIASSDYQEVIEVALNPSDAFKLAHALADTQTTGTLSVEISVPSNIEFVEISTTNDSHAGSLVYEGGLPLVLRESATIDLVFDNTIAGLADLETATGIVQLIWENLDGSTDQVEIPYTVTARGSKLTVIYEVPSVWSDQEVYGIDDVIIRSNATVLLDETAAAASLSIEEGALELGQDYTLTLSESLAVDAGGTLQVNNGVLVLNTNAFHINGSVVIDGGRVEVAELGVTGSGTLQLKSGELRFNTGTLLDIDLLEIIGGIADFGNYRVYLGRNGSSELRVVGSDASISMSVLNLQPWTTKDPTLRFVLDEASVSTINVSSYMNLATAKVIVDGSSYSGGAKNLVLIDSTNLATLGDTNNFSTLGFAEKGLVATVLQDQTDGKDWLELVITETPYNSWVRGFDLTGTDLDKTANPDGDAYTNEEEYIAGLNPEVVDAFLINGLDNGNTLAWDAVSGRAYSVYWASNLVDGFTRIASNLVEGTFFDSNADAEEQGFYKIIVELEP